MRAHHRNNSHLSLTHTVTCDAKRHSHQRPGNTAEHIRISCSQCLLCPNCSLRCQCDCEPVTYALHKRKKGIACALSSRLLRPELRPALPSPHSCVPSHCANQQPRCPRPATLFDFRQRQAASTSPSFSSTKRHISCTRTLHSACVRFIGPVSWQQHQYAEPTVPHRGVADVPTTILSDPSAFDARAFLPRS